MPPWIVTTASGAPEQRADPLGQVVQRVAVLGEDDQLPPVPVRRRTSPPSILQQAAEQFLPLSVGPAAGAPAGPALPGASAMSISASSSAIVRAAVAWSTTCSSTCLDLVVGRVVQVVDVVIREIRQAFAASRSLPIAPPRLQ